MYFIGAIFSVIGVIVGIIAAVKNDFGFLGFACAIIIGHLGGFYIGVATAKIVNWKERRRIKQIERHLREKAIPLPPQFRQKP